MEDPRAAPGNRRRRPVGVHTFTRCFCAEQSDRFVGDEVVEHPHGVGAAAHTGADGVGQLAFDFHQLALGFLPNDFLKVTHHLWIGVGAHHGTDQIMGGFHVGGPVAHGLVDGVLQRSGAAVDRYHLCAQQLHAVDVERLAFHVCCPHIDFAFHSEQRSGGRCRHAVLASASLRNDALFAHAFRQQNLAQDIVDLVGARVVEVLALDIDLCAAEILCHFLRIVENGGPSGIVLIVPGELLLKIWVVFICCVGGFQLVYRVHHGFRHILAAVFAVSSDFTHVVLPSCLIP